jgi:Tol biopolymer transport system component/tRNA A-37 threonylcarbamoyl transferase component Bud32
MVGTTVANFQVLERLGQGGMGVVYKARDTKLGRLVALKVISANLLIGPEHKHRFLREAKVASALNHPNIVTIYDLIDSGGIDIIVMEYVAGSTLDQIISQKKLKLPDALRYAIQIADALATAHRAGIIHRDIKPANVIVTPEGSVKVLDFGLAKLLETHSGADTESTQAMGWADESITEKGMIVGTVAYVSPEQAEGKPVDARSDVFSFGSLLYELLSGDRPFRGGTKMSVLSAVLSVDPKPLREIDGRIPSELERIVVRCLRKDPHRRFQTMADVRIELEEVKEDSEAGKSVAAAPAGRQKHAGARVSLFLLFFLVTAGAGLWLIKPSNPARQANLRQLTRDTGLTTDPALSRDGKLLAYASDRAGDGNLDIWVQQLGGAEPLRLTREATDERKPVFSPDGTRIAFRAEQDGGGIYVIPTLGGEPKRIVPLGRDPQFSPDGNQIAYWVGPSGEGVIASASAYIVNAAGGVPRQAAAGLATSTHPIWSPDGKFLLLAVRQHRQADWWAVPVDGGPPVKTGALDALRKQNLTIGSVANTIVPEIWAADGEHVIFSARSGDTWNIWQIGLSPSTFQVTGRAERLSSGTTLEQSPTAGAAGQLAFASINESTDVWSLPVRQGTIPGQLRQVTRDGTVRTPAIASGDQKLVYVSSKSGQSEVYSLHLDTGRENKLTESVIPKLEPLPNRTGTKVAYLEHSAPPALFMISLRPEGQPVLARKICDGCSTPSDWTRDEASLLISRMTRTRMGAVLVQSGSPQVTEVLSHADRSVWHPTFSADERWILFEATDGVHSGIYVAPYRGRAIRDEEWIQVTDAGSWDDKPRWAPADELVYYTSDRDGFRCVWAQRLDRITRQPVGSAIAVYHAHNSRRSLLNVDLAWLDLAVARDQLLFNMTERTGNIWMLHAPER